MQILKDKYRRARGDSSKVYNLHCSTCKNYILTYQKDGPGHLKRLYLNRIMKPVKLANLKNDSGITSTNDFKALRCDKCDTLIGLPMLYEDGRFAFRLNMGSLYKELLKQNI